MPDFQFYFELIGAVAFAVSGAALAVKKGMDLFGVAVMGMTTAVGGGILRDMLLGLTPPAALKDPLQALVAIATSLLLFIVWKKWHPSGNHRVWESVLLAADSLGLGVFSVHGAAVAIRAGYGANVFLVLLVGVLISVGFASNYYNSARSTLRAKAAAGADYFNTYVMTSYREYYRSATVYAAAFDDGDRIELQFLNSSGRVEVTTRGVTVGTYPGTPEIYSAIESGEVKDYVGRDVVTGERIMAASSLLKFNGQVVGVMRYVTAIGNIDRQVLLTVLLVAGVMVAVVGLIVLSSMIFINNVVAPVSAVSEAAKRISGGSYGVQIPNKYSDEMGELVDNINDMSRKIGESERMKSEFISSVSHELRTPLTAINGWGETLLADESNDVQQIKRGVQIMVKESRRLTNMVEELLQFSRLEDGRFTLQVEDTDLQAELEDAVYSYRELFRQDGIALEYSSDRAEYSEVISGDPERLKQVFCNLLDNAAKHGGGGKRITVHLTQRDGEYVITIRDFGPGIPEAELPYVKQKFYKGSSKARGSGIGLAVCDEIVQRHGGRLDIANAEGGGTVVTVYLPLKKQAEAAL